ncbi:Apoptosis-related protein/predicted DNA-binding protein [Phaffia rhodozyma]|uniref:Apoptosis-related protein/predicted DNA-binding protein n=1 Tax=Phaffia rhodozyma TaxID=264483 RepID=A0A0F7SR37_PHARH|nr:Apoptosis-related protein/predicted DNA-binding protein [Phaffia rhodozyma]
MDEDDDLNAIRARRLAQLQAQGGGGGGGGRGGMGGPPSGGAPGQGGKQLSQEEQEAQRRAEEEQLRTIMATVLEPAARERLSRINLTRPQLSKQVQNILLRMAQGGQLRGKVSDEQLVGLLEQAQGVAASSGGSGKIVFQRKSRDSDDDDDFDL